MNFLKRNEEEILHYIMTFTGGFIGLYAMCAHGSFASAQTGNLMKMVRNLAGGDIYDFAVKMGAFVLYSAGIGVSWMMHRAGRLPMRELSIGVDAAALAMSAFMPESVDPFFRLYPLFAATSFQWGAFEGVGKYKSSGLFLTGNLKNGIVSCLEYLTGHDAEKLIGARIYTLTILGFLAGGYYGCIAVKCQGVKGAFWGYVPLALAGAVIATGYICGNKSTAEG